jgi:manganese oxidase
MNGDWKEFHLVAEPVVREFAPGMKVYLWGYNGQSPGPTIEAVEGDKVRIFVTNKLPEKTTIHWHGQRLPNGMDGVGGVTQPHIPAGKTFVYEFQLQRSGSFMYHPHSDEMVQLAMGMMGFFVVHPRDAAFRRVDRDFVFLMNSHSVEPGNYVPKVSEMTNFNMWTWNSRVFPGIDPVVAAKGDKVRIRMGNLSMTNHPIHLHGVEFIVSCTDGGWVPEQAAWPEVTVDIGVGQIRAIDFVANAPGDWAFHCHKSHHTMNSMGHDVRTYIGADIERATERLKKLVPGYMPMGADGMGMMGEMEMPGPDATYDDRRRPVWAHRDGRHVHDSESTRRPFARRLQGPGLVRASSRYRCARSEGRRRRGAGSATCPGYAPESKLAGGQAGHDARYEDDA